MKMMLTLRQAYIAAYDFLSPFYDKTKDDKLLDLLSCMNPFLWKDGGSADPATYEDWLDSAKKITNKEQLNAKQAFQIMLEFLRFHKNEFNYAPEWIITDLEKKTHNNEGWLRCVSKVIDETT